MRIVLAIFSGIVANFLVIFGVEQLTQLFVEIPPLKSGMQPDYKASSFTGLLVMIVLAHVVGLVVGLWVTRKIERQTSLPLFFVALSMVIGSLVNVAMIPHPIWFSILDPIALCVCAFVFYNWSTRITD